MCSVCQAPAGRLFWRIEPTSIVPNPEENSLFLDGEPYFNPTRLGVTGDIHQRFLKHDAGGLRNPLWHPEISFRNIGVKLNAWVRGPKRFD